MRRPRPHGRHLLPNADHCRTHCPRPTPPLLQITTTPSNPSTAPLNILSSSETYRSPMQGGAIRSICLLLASALNQSLQSSLSNQWLNVSRHQTNSEWVKKLGQHPSSIGRVAIRNDGDGENPGRWQCAGPRGGGGRREPVLSFRAISFGAKNVHSSMILPLTRIHPYSLIHIIIG